MTNRLLPIVLGSVALAATTGCGSKDEPSTPESASAAATPVAAEGKLPYGTYERRVTAADIERTAAERDEHGPRQQTPGTGRYRLIIAQGPKLDVLKAIGPDDFPVAMDAEGEANDVLALPTYIPGQGTFCGPEIPQSGRYRFSAAGPTLELTPAEPDPCADRDSILTGAWTKR